MKKRDVLYMFHITKIYEQLTLFCEVPHAIERRKGRNNGNTFL